MVTFIHFSSHGKSPMSESIASRQFNINSIDIPIINTAKVQGLYRLTQYSQVDPHRGDPLGFPTTGPLLCIPAIN